MTGANGQGSSSSHTREQITQKVCLRAFGRLAYEIAHQKMQDFTEQRTGNTHDEIWWLEHPPVYTLGLTGNRSHLLRAVPIPVYHSDRGGQITYHGPGQLVVYTLLDLRRRGLTPRSSIRLLEQAVLNWLKRIHQIDAVRIATAPGVYVAGEKIATVGLRIRRGCCYHGLAINVDMNLSPYRDINPCGYSDLAVTQLSALGAQQNVAQAAATFLPFLLELL